MKKLLAIAVLFLCMTVLTACHGSRGLDAFEIPAEFDTSRNYEITFWQRTTPT